MTERERGGGASLSKHDGDTAVRPATAIVVSASGQDSGSMVACGFL